MGRRQDKTVRDIGHLAAPVQLRPAPPYRLLMPYRIAPMDDSEESCPWYAWPIMPILLLVVVLVALPVEVIEYLRWWRWHRWYERTSG